MSVLPTDQLKAVLIQILSELNNINPFEETIGETDYKIIALTCKVNQWLEEV